MSPATKHADCIIRPTDSVANTQPSARARDIERAPAKLQPTCRYVRARARARACACTPLGCACRPSFLQLVSADGAMAGAAALARTRRCATHEHALVLARVVAPADASARRAGVRCDVCGRALDVLRTVHCCVECDWVVRQRLPPYNAWLRTTVLQSAPNETQLGPLQADVSRKHTPHSRLQTPRNAHVRPTRSIAAGDLRSLLRHAACDAHRSACHAAYTMQRA
jgi:hypothetical protein